MKGYQSCCRTSVEQLSQLSNKCLLWGVLCHWQPGIDVCRTTIDANGAAHVKSQRSDKGQIQGWVWAFCEKQIRIDFVKIMVPSANPGPFTRHFGLFSPPPPGVCGERKILEKKKCRCSSWWWFTNITNFGKNAFFKMQKYYCLCKITFIQVKIKDLLYSPYVSKYLDSPVLIRKQTSWLDFFSLFF